MVACSAPNSFKDKGANSGSPALSILLANSSGASGSADSPFSGDPSCPCSDRSTATGNSPAVSLSMKTTLRRSGMTENPLENEDRCASWRPWIIESAGEPLNGTFLPGYLSPHLTEAGHDVAWQPRRCVKIRCRTDTFLHYYYSGHIRGREYPPQFQKSHGCPHTPGARLSLKIRPASITVSPDASGEPSMVLHDNLGSRVSENRSPHSNSLSCFRTFLLSRTK
jgi:hypothetical protein